MRITYSRKFEKQYEKLSNTAKDLAEEKFDIFISDPFDSRLKTHKLGGRFSGYHAFSINNKYRIIFEFFDDDKVRFHYVGNRDIY